MAYAFSSIKKPNLYQSDYVAEKRSRLVSSNRMLYNKFRTNVKNNTELSSGLYNKMYLKNVCSIIKGEPCTTQESCIIACNEAVPIDQGITEPFYVTNTIDPTGILFGSSSCGFNNFINFSRL